jgi:Flp pilus assembly CpaE family ATPase
MYFDVVVINTGSTWADYHAQLLENCDSVLFVLDQRASSIRSTKHALELCMRLGIARTNFTFLLNKSSKTAAFSALDISCALDGERVVEIKDGGNEVEELLGAGHMEELLDTNDDYVQSINLLMDQLFETIRIPARGAANNTVTPRQAHVRREPKRLTKSYLRGFKKRQSKAQFDEPLPDVRTNNFNDKDAMVV